MTHPSTLRTLVAAGLFLLATAACGGGEIRAILPEDGSETQTSAVLPPIAGGSPAQRALLRELLHGLQPSAIARVAIRPADLQWRPFPPGSVELITAAKGRASKLPTWEASLLGGAFRDRSAELGLPPVIALTRQHDSVLLGPAGSRLHEPVLDQPVASPRERDALVDRINEAAAASRSEIASLRLVAPQGLGFAVQLRVDDPAAFLKNRLALFFTNFGDRSQYEGMHLTVLDARGALVFQASHAARISAYSLYIRPDLERCSPVAYIGVSPDRRPPPPCPSQ